MSHLTLEQRYQIQLLWQNGEGITQIEIATRIGKSRSVVSRELSRNRNEEGNYLAQTAMKKYRKRRQRGSYKVKGDLLVSIKKNLKRKRSPEQIANTIKDAQGGKLISHEAIYQYVYDEKLQGGRLYKHLRRSHRKRRKRLKKTDKRGKIPNRMGIEKRLECVQSKSRFGDWEGDTIIGAKHQGAILTLTERKSKYELIAKLDSLEADHVEKVIIKTLKKSKMPVHTITFDNGREFTNHQKNSKALKAEIYFANPYSPWERGLNRSGEP